MNEIVTTIFGLLGGLALFLYGMNNMSDALQKAAGEKMKKILEFLTKNPLMGALAGMLVTAVLQSSSATTVMVIGFVSAGMMSLPQAISVIFGANIGTTMTAQLLAFKISDYIYPIIFIGFMMNFAFKKEKIKNIGMVILSFGLLFEGIEIMGSVMKPLAASPIFVNLMGKVADIPVLGVLLGAVMTLVVQSSSATIAVLQNFASQAGADGVSSVIGLSGAIPILLGDNIGTTITALLASVGQSKNAKRTALAHSIFNITGSIAFVCIIPYFSEFVRFISPKGNEIDVISRQIANAHTIFNMVCTLIWLPLIPVMVKIVKWLVRGGEKAEKDFSKPVYLDNKMLNQPVAAMYLISKEISRCAEFTVSMLKAAQKEIIDNEVSQTSGGFDELYTTVKGLQDKIGIYISRLFANGVLTEIQSEQVAGLLFITNNIERIADYSNSVTIAGRSLRSHGKDFSEQAREDLNKCFEISNNLFTKAVAAVQNGDVQAAKEMFEYKEVMHKAQKVFSKAHLKRVKKNTCDSSLTNDFSSILYNIDRIADNCVGIAEAVLDHVSFVSLEAGCDIAS